MSPIRLRLLSGDPGAVERLRQQLAGLGYAPRDVPNKDCELPEWALDPGGSEEAGPPSPPAVLETILAHMDEPVLACARDATLSRLNPPAHALFPEIAEGSPLDDWSPRLGLFHKDGHTPLALEELPVLRALHEGPTEALQIIARDTAGTMRTLTARGRPVTDDRGTLQGAVMIMRDHTDQERSKRQVRRQRDLYAALSQVNQFVVLQKPDPDSVFKAISEIAVTYGGLRLAWVGMPDTEGWVHPVAASGDASDYLHHLAISTDPDLPEGHGPTGIAMREGRHVVEPDIVTDPTMSPWHTAAEAAGLRSSAAFPIHRNGEVVASLNVYADEADYFSDDLLHLLDEMVLDISFALDHHDRMAEHRRLVEIIEATPDVVGMADSSGNVLYHNPAAMALLGRERTEGNIAESHPPESLTLLQKEALPTAREYGMWRGETEILRADGSPIPFSQTIIAHRAPQGDLTHFSTIARDISDQKEAQSEIRRLAYRDTDTGLPNRASLKERLDQEISRAHRQGTCGALLYLDLDQFKAINDSLGHPAGDAMLQALATRLRSQLRPEDILARVGGDEFVVLLPDMGTQVEEAALAAEHVAEALLGSMRQRFQVADNQLVATASVGITLFPEADTDRDTLLQQADAAMFSAKAEGPGNIHFFHPRMLEAVRHRLDLEQDLRTALEEGQLLLHYQPLIALGDESVMGLEALLRWHHPQRGWISPAEFIPVAEESGLILEIGEWVLQEAFRQLGSWRSAGLWPGPLGLGINISPRQFAQPDFFERVAGMLEIAGIPGDWIKLEITENLLIEHMATAVERMEALRRMGLSLAVDDFGTGYSSLAYLHQLPVTTLKVDRSLITGTDSGQNSSAIVEAVLAMGDRLGLSMVAEGVETPGQAAFLMEHGCTAGQGFLWSPAIPPADLADRLPPIL